MAVRPSESGVLIYDGDCGFCTASARWVADRAGPDLKVAPWQALDLTGYGLTPEDTATAAYWAGHEETPLRGADGLARAAQQCTPRWVRAVGRIAAQPPVIWLARRAYPFIARNRHRLPGSTGSCRLG